MDDRATAGTSGPPWMLHAAGLGAFLLSIPRISAAIFAALAFQAAVRLTGSVEWRFAARLGLLALFGATYAVAVWGHGLVPAGDALKSALFVVGAYAAGYAAGDAYGRDRPERVAWLVVVLAAGLGVFAFLCVESAGVSIADLEIADRSVPSFWSPSEVVNAPGLGAMGSLGLCLAPVVVLGSREGLAPRHYLGLWIASALLAAGGAVVNLALLNRSPLLALGLAFAAAAAIAVFRPGRPWRRAAIAVAALLVVGGVAYAVFASDAGQSLFLFQRLREERLESQRYEAWRRMLAGLFAAPLGGRTVNLGGLPYAHNAWLDIAYDAGIVPMALALAFHVSHVGPIARRLRSAWPVSVRAIVAGVLAAFLVTFLGEPAMAFSITYFAASCYLLGLLLATSPEVAP